MNSRLKTLYFVFCLNSCLFLGELIVAIRTSSVALKADAFHVLSDVLATLITIYSIKLATKDKTSHATYGWLRSEIIGGLINSVFLLALAFNIFIEAIEKLTDIDEIKDKLGDGINEVFIVGWVGLVINLFSLYVVHLGHRHDKDEVQSYLFVDEEEILHKHQKPGTKQKKSKGVGVRGLWLHIIGDIMGSIVVIISSSTIKYSDASFRFYLDPSVSLISVTLICTVTYPLLSKCRRILLHHVPKNIDMIQLEEELNKINNITNVHELHVWQLDDEKLIGSLHFNLEHIDNIHNIGNIVKQSVMDIKKVFHKYGIHSTTIQPEFHFKNLDDNEMVDIDIADYLDEHGNDSEIRINVHNDCVDITCNENCNYKKCCSPDNKKKKDTTNTLSI